MAAPAYLLLGPENGDKQDKLKEILASIKKEVGSEPEIHRFYAFEGEDDKLFSALDNNSFFSDHRLVILSKIEDLSTQTANAVGKYLTHPSSTATLVLISDETYVKLPQITKQIPKENTITFWEMFDNQKQDWVRQFFRRQGITITGEAIDTLLEQIENNTTEMKTICSQLALFWQTDKRQGPIDADAVETYIEHSKNEDGYTLFPAMVKRDLKQSLRILHAILETGDSSTSFTLHAQLLWQFRRLFSVVQLYAASHDENTAFRDASVLGTKAAIFNFRDKQLYRTGLRTYSEEQMKTVMMALGDADIPIKAAGDLTPLEWEKLVYAIVVDSKSFKAPEIFIRP